MHILVDMDGVIANWGKKWDKVLDNYYPNSGANIRRHSEQTSFDLREGLTPHEIEIVEEVMAWDGFYADLEPISGAIEALHEMVAEGHSVDLCSTPWLLNETCVQDKLAWVARHLGEEWVARVILTTDKTRIRGDFIIDDKPEIHGEFVAEWEHILFDQPYNADVTDKRRLSDWREWREALEAPEEPRFRTEESVNGVVLPHSSELLAKEFFSDYVGSAEPEEFNASMLASAEANARIQRAATKAIADHHALNGVHIDHTEVGPNVKVEERVARGGEVRKVSSTGGEKGQKLAQLSALDPHSIQLIAEVAGFGAEKYSKLNFMKGYDWSLSYDALQRHLHAFWNGEDFDRESSMLHLAHAGWHALALISFFERGLGTDDRYTSTPELSKLQTKEVW